MIKKPISLFFLAICLYCSSNAQGSGKFRSSKIGFMAGVNWHSPTPPGSKWNGGVIYGCNTTFEDIDARMGGHGKFMLERRFQNRWSFLLDIGFLGSKSSYLENNSCSHVGPDSLLVRETFYSSTKRNDLVFRLFSGLQFSQTFGPIRAGIALGLSGNVNGARLANTPYENGVPGEGTIDRIISSYVAPSGGISAVYQMERMEWGLHYRATVGFRKYDPRDSRFRSYPRSHTLSLSWGYLFGRSA